ncbi:protein-arginine deiminase type-4-like [Globicephala melas]|uniref:protein-arginine deiminase type-4-like n=1 Tax=Globicephala melas TaxID=9731 RepID=UPI003873AF16
MVRVSLAAFWCPHCSAPKDCTSFSINASPGVVVDVAHRRPAKKNLTGSSKWPLDPGLEVSLKMRAASDSTGDRKVQISHYGPETTPVEVLLYIPGVEISLSADFTRTGKMKSTGGRKDQRTWTWGPHGQGAILLVNCDRDNPKSSTVDCKDDQLDSKDLKDMSLVTLSTKTPRDFSKHQLVLHVAKSEMDKVRCFEPMVNKQPSRYGMILGPRHPSHPLEPQGGHHSTDFYVEGLASPDASFPGLISLNVSLLHIIIDEMEIGYTQAPHKTLPVVFASPRNRGLKDFPIKCMLEQQDEFASCAETLALLADFSPIVFHGHVSKSLSFNALLSEAILVLKDTSTPLAFSTVALLVPSVINHQTVYFPSSVSPLDWKHHKGTPGP